MSMLRQVIEEDRIFIHSYLDPMSGQQYHDKAGGVGCTDCRPE